MKRFIRALGRVLEQGLVGVALCAVAISIAVAALTAPWFTRAATVRAGAPSLSGLPARTAVETAEGVRLFVTSRGAPALPANVDGRAGFDAGAVSHLEDVREVVLASRLAGAVLAVILMMWAAVRVRGRSWAAIASSLRWGGILCVVAPVAVGVVGLVDFDALFTAFHALFFAEGTWTFPADSLLIQLFPEAFWSAAAASLVLFVVVQGVLLWAVGAAVARRARGAPSKAR